MSIPLSIQPVMYGPTPLHTDQGEQAFFTFKVVTDPARVYTSLIAKVKILDGNGNVLRTIETPVTVGESGQAVLNLAWDGKDDDGDPIPPGEYAPTYVVTGEYDG